MTLSILLAHVFLVAKGWWWGEIKPVRLTVENSDIIRNNSNN